MSHQAPSYYSYVSEHVSSILDNVGYSQDDRDSKLRVATETELFRNISMDFEKIGARMYIFGSRGEGSTGPGLHSDRDILYHPYMFKVVTDISECQLGKCNVLMVKDNITHPGYVKLQHIVLLPHNTPNPVFHVESIDGFCATDSCYRSLLPNTIIHSYGPVCGPALHVRTDLKEYSIDRVIALRSSRWPHEGYEWFSRRKRYGWPSHIQIENAKEYGCFATPVGHPNSSESHLEWRLSFSIAERDITRSFDDTTMKVYILLKMIKQAYIKPVVGDAFSSYHCKVCMMWMRERTPSELWSNANLLYCLVLCIGQLNEWVTTGFCPDYFIVTNNIYDRKIVGSVRVDLVQILKNLLSADCTFLLGIKCCNLGQQMVNGISRFDNMLIPRIVEEDVNYKMSIEEASRSRYAIFTHIPQHYPTLIDYLKRITHASKYLPYNMHYPLKHMSMVLWSHLGFHLATICRQNARLLSGDHVNYLVNLTSGCLSLGINSDATSVRLKLCGLGMELGNYELIDACLQHISDYWIRCMYAATVDKERRSNVLECNVKFCMEKQLTKRYNTEELLQTQVSFSVVYLPQELSITPKPMRMEMFRSAGASAQLRKQTDSWFDWGVVDSLMGLYFFQYLNFSRRGKERHKEVAMDNMIHVIRTEPKILHRDTAFNLLGYSFMQENQLTNAFRCFIQSLKIRPHHNAAKFYLGILFKRVLATPRLHIRY